MKPDHGVFTVSLDFELYWGVRDRRSIEQYRENLDGVWQAIPAMLKLFRDYGIHATWATVGFLFCRDRDELNENLPAPLPRYRNAELSPYGYIERAPHLDPAYHFAPELIELIRRCEHQEIATHTFSHYYCQEAGQSADEFAADLQAAVALARRRGIHLRSLVFPRNQWNADYLAILPRLGIRCYRGNEASRIYRACEDADNGRLDRALRLLDTYVNLSGHNTHELDECLRSSPFNFPASRFLRPWSARLAPLDGLRLARIRNAMSDAALHHRLFHLWWHPHNFGRHLEKNLEFLEKVLAHYARLQRSHGLQSLSMGELCQLANAGHGQPSAARAERSPNETIRDHSG
ncbi:polysaccharide deacetylase family protein [Pseudomonas stutzeri]|nr:polysaccharide deacetylase family protein [Stutzerimonas stutzeri]